MTGFSVGIVGLDAMGGALSRRFDQEGVGHSATDLNSRMLQAHLANGGSAPAGSPYDLAQMCNLIFMTETSDDMLRESVTGPTGLYHRLQPGTLIVDMSDVSPQTGQALARSVVSKGAVWIEATPVGGPSNVRNGDLTLLLAGPEDHIESIRPVLQSFAGKTLRLGELGSGGLAKSLAASLGLASLLLHTEFMATARKLGLDPAGLADALPLLAPEAGAPPSFLKDVVSGGYNSGVSLRQAQANMQRYAQAAGSAGAPLLFTSLVQAALTSAASAPGADGDQLDAARWLAANAGVVFSSSLNEPSA